MNDIDIAIIVNSFNRLDLLREALEALSGWIPKSEYKNRIVCVVFDAYSTDGTVEWLERESYNFEFPINLILPKVGESTSFAAGLNAGVRFAENICPNLKYLLFYETDNQILQSKPITHALSKLEEIHDLGACGFTVRKHNGNPAGIGQPFPTLFNFVLGKNLVHIFQLEKIPFNWEKSESEIEFSFLDIVYSSPLLVRIEAWKASGGLDAESFPFSECDIDWAKRLSNLGWRMGIVRSDSVIHDNKEKISSWSKDRSLQFHRARLRYFMRHKPSLVYFVWPCLLLLRHFAEFCTAKIIVRDVVRRNQLSNQFLNLLIRSTNQYN